jgi:hypothetical protein
MNDLIETIVKTREIASEISVKSLINLDNISEVELVKKIIAETTNHSELFPKGWYDPPPSGVAVLFDTIPFTRLQFKSLRNPESFPNEQSVWKKESVGIVYLSPVDIKTKMIGDIGFTIYNGNDEKIKEHIKKCYEATYSMAEHAKVGMKFSELYSFAINLFKKEFKIIGWMTTTSDPNLGINLGHTIPGSFKNDLNFGNSFEEIRDTIKNNRIYINNVENFIIPETCAFTVEARLEDINNPNLPSVYFHFIVVFNKGEKAILGNFEKIFKTAKMNYV